MDITYYRESESYDLISLLFGVLSLLIALFVVGYVYQFAMSIVPIIYLNVLICAGTSYLISLILRLVFRLAKIRSFKVRLYLIATAILAFTYFQWSAFLGSLLSEEFLGLGAYLESLTLIFNADLIVALFKELYTYGTFSIGSIQHGIPVNQSLYVVLWIIEFGLLALFSALLIKKYGVLPFSENTGKWYPKYLLEDNFKVAWSEQAVLEGIKEKGLLEYLEEHKYGDAIKHLKFFVYYLEEEHQAYLTVEKHQIADRGKGKKEVSPLIENLRIDKQLALQILDKFSNERVRLAI